MENQTPAEKINGGRITLVPGAYMNPSFIIQTPEKPKLRLFVNADGKVDAEYDPEDLTEAALLFVAELRRVGES